MTRLENPSTEPTPAARLLAAVDGLRGRGGRERSAKLTQGNVAFERFLLSFHKSAFGLDPARAIARLAADLAMPAAFVEAAIRLLPEADIVHLGFEAGRDASLFKLYLEFAAAYRAGAEEAYRRRQPMLVHQAFKWADVSPGARAISLYHALPVQTGAEMAGALRSIGGGVALDIALALLEQAERRVPAEALLLMQVEEPGNPRLSFDLNLYPAEFSASDLGWLFDALVTGFTLPAEAAARLRTAMGEGVLGHVSGGIGRDAEPFLTLYFGIEPFQ